MPFHRTEWTAAEIVASFVLDLAQIEAYGLPEPGAALLTTLARWEMRTLLDHGLRLRTACDLVVTDPDVRDTAGVALPAYDELTEELAKLAEQAHDLLGAGGPLDVVWNGGQAKGRRARAD